MSKQTYDPALRKTEHGSNLYQTWRKILHYPHCEEWDYFPTFYEWAMHNGYEVGMWVRRKDKKVPFNAQNCYLYVPNDDGVGIPKESIDRWNKTVNRIRKYYGMPPLEGTDYGDL